MDLQIPEQEWPERWTFKSQWSDAHKRAMTVGDELMVMWKKLPLIYRIAAIVPDADGRYASITLNFVREVSEEERLEPTH